jgi:hypothetical protein
VKEPLADEERGGFGPIFSAEDVGYWFFRLNGFLTTRNFVVHPDGNTGQRTDADLLAVRFPYRSEQDMPDDVLFTSRAWPLLMLVEIKSGKCHFNGPWTNPAAGNLTRVLKAIGAFPNSEVSHVAADLYRAGMYKSSGYEVCLVALGNEVDGALKTALPKAKQITWDQVFRFISDRFVFYRHQKADAPQWDDSGRELYALAQKAAGDLARFDADARKTFRIPPAPLVQI